MKQVLYFVFERETKGTIRFKEIVPEGSYSPKIGTLYVQKTALKDGKIPKGLWVTIEDKEPEG